MKKFTFILLINVLFFSTSLFAQDRGTIVGDPVLLMSADPDAIMENLPLEDQIINLIDLLTNPKHNVVAYKIIYNTIDGKGNKTTASGVVFFPVVDSPTAMPMFSYLHGTLTSDMDVPSSLSGIQSMIGWIMAMGGYISVLPDYIGLGESPGFHPFSHAASEASASVDLIKAVQSLCLTNPLINFDENLYLSGYSQGAHAALAVQRELESHPIPGINLQKTVAGSGAYSLSFIQKNFLFNNPTYPNPSFLPYLMLGYQEVYGNLYSNLKKVFMPPFYESIPVLFDRVNTVEEIDKELPVAWKDMFKNRYLQDIQYQYFHPVNVALRDNDLIKWKPKNDLHLYYCNCDEIVAKENSWMAYLSFILRGSRNVTCLPLGNFNHVDCAPYVLLLAKIQFDCASGVNSCGINLLSLLKSATETDLNDFTSAVMNVGQFPAADEILQNNELLAYFNEPVNVENIRVYPNPASDMVNIQLPADGSLASRISLYDMQGRLIMDKTFNTTTIQLDVKPLQNGVYQIVVNGNATLAKTLVVFK